MKIMSSTSQTLTGLFICSNAGMPLPFRNPASGLLSMLRSDSKLVAKSAGFLAAKKE